MREPHFVVVESYEQYHARKQHESKVQLRVLSIFAFSIFVSFFIGAIYGSVKGSFSEGLIFGSYFFWPIVILYFWSDFTKNPKTFQILEFIKGLIYFVLGVLFLLGAIYGFGLKEDLGPILFMIIIGSLLSYASYKKTSKLINWKKTMQNKTIFYVFIGICIFLIISSYMSGYKVQNKSFIANQGPQILTNDAGSKDYTRSCNQICDGALQSRQPYLIVLNENAIYCNCADGQTKSLPLTNQIS